MQPEGLTLGGGFLDLLGGVIEEASGDVVVIRTPVTDSLMQPYGIVHGGVYCALAETAASVAGALWLSDGRSTAGVANHTNFLHATRSGELVTRALPIHRGRMSQLWAVSITDGAGREVARSEVRLANLSRPELMGRPRTD
jgi:1,4-dihydroxy-2-naphthoyl-CoA hydrolase